MKKIVLGFVLTILGMGIVIASGFISLASVMDNSEDNETYNEEKGIPLYEDIGKKEEKDNKDKENTIEAIIHINPNKLNCKSKGKWITAYIGLPSPYNVEEIDIDSIFLQTINGEINSCDDFPNEIADIYGDSNPELMVKFERPALIIILERVQFSEIFITGKLQDKITFEWGGVIELIHY